MKRIIAALLALLALLSTAAQAQLAVPLQPCAADRPDLPVPAAVRPAGLPQQLGGQCTLGVFEANANGAAVAYWCAHPAPTPATLYLYAVRWSAITPAMLADYAQLGLPGDNAERIRAMQARYQTANIADMCDVWGPAIDRINASMPATMALPVWVVAPNPLSTTTPPTRASFAVVNGMRSYSSTGMVTVGAACDCTAISLTEGRTTFCSVAPSRVSVCTKP